MPTSHYLLQVGKANPHPKNIDHFRPSDILANYVQPPGFNLLYQLANDLTNLPDFHKLRLGEVPENIRILVENALKPIPNLNSYLTAGFESIIDKHLIQSADAPVYIDNLKKLCFDIASNFDKSNTSNNKGD